MFALRNAYRGIFVSVNYLAAAEILHARGLWAPAISQSYTAAYHCLGSYLANLGRVIVLTRRFGAGFMVPDQPVVATLTKRGQWSFEATSLNHAGRWKLLTPYLASRKPKPKFFKDLFDYLYADEYETTPPWEEVRAALISRRPLPQPTSWSLEKKAPEFLERIAATRHESLYVAAGSDPRVVEALINRESFSTHGIDRQSRAFLDFAGQMLWECVRMTERLATAARLNKETRSWLFLAVDYPWFDDIEYDLLSDGGLAGRIRGLRSRLCK